jgi:hypothetical protein
MRAGTAACALGAALALCAACGGRPEHGPEGEAPEAANAAAAPILRRVPETVDPEARYLFYLHGAIVETGGPRPTHPRFGVYEYEAICAALAARGLQVLSEARPSGTRVPDYAAKVADQVEALTDAGVPADHITVAGHSKGGLIAAAASSLVDDPRVNYVILAGCGPHTSGSQAPRMRGRILSIFEVSDDLAEPCAASFRRAAPDSETNEIVLAVGGGHGAFYRPQEAWIDPLVGWARPEP